MTPVTAIDEPSWLPSVLVPTWRTVTGDLCSMGAVFPSDIILLNQAFRLYANTLRFQAQLDLLHDAIERNKKMAEDLMDAFDGKPDPHTAIQIAELATGCASEIAKINSSMISNDAAYERILGKFGIGPSDRARLLSLLPPRKEHDQGPSLDDLLT